MSKKQFIESINENMIKRSSQVLSEQIKRGIARKRF